MTGFSPSVVRAVIMAIIVLIGQILYRETDIITSLSFAAVILLVFSPITLFNMGFQLSFAATFSLILFYKHIKKLLSFKFIPKYLTDLLAVTLSAQLGVLPITAFYFNKISLISVFTNIVVVPLTGIITILGFYYGNTRSNKYFSFPSDRIYKLYILIFHSVNYENFCKPSFCNC